MKPSRIFYLIPCLQVLCCAKSLPFYSFAENENREKRFLNRIHPKLFSKSWFHCDFDFFFFSFKRCDLFRILFSVFRSENGDDEDDQTTCCKLCKCCTPCFASVLCLPCRRLKKISSCCNRSKKLADEKKAAEITTSILNEKEKANDGLDNSETESKSCWKCMKCCNRKKQQMEGKIMDEMATIEQQATQATRSAMDVTQSTVKKERGKCSLCLAKVFCCRNTNKIQSSSDNEMAPDDDEQNSGCCSCLPCRRKKKEPSAWRAARQDSLVSVDNLQKK